MDQTVQVQIEAVYPRKDRRPASIKTAAGDYFGLPDGYAALGLQQGMVGEVTYYTKQGNQGKVFYNATKWNGQDIPKGQAIPAQPIMQQPLHPQAVVTPQPVQQPIPTQQQMNESVKEEAIFITGIVGRSMQSGQFSITDIDALTKAARAAWLNRASGTTFAPEPQGDPGQPFDSDLNDQIPI